MSDLFHEDVPFDFIQKVFGVMSRARQHRFQVLTKRSERLEQLAEGVPWPGNVWIGVSVESADYAYRIEHLRHVPASTRFVSFEPLLARVPVTQYQTSFSRAPCGRSLLVRKDGAS